MLKTFKAPPSNFWDCDTDRKLQQKAEYGDWWAPYYDYVHHGQKIWLVISDKPIVTIQGETFTLKARNGINIKGLTGLEKPGTYRLWYKMVE